MKATINDVARLAGVSMKTVSRVINNEPTVKKATYDKVMEAVQALQYQPNLAARNLAGTKSYTIAFMYNNPNAYYVIDMQNGLLRACRENGYELLIHPLSVDHVNVDEEIDRLVQHSRIAGLVLTPPFSEMPEVIAKLDAVGVDYVRVISGSSTGESNCVLVDDYNAAVAVTEHLLALGHQHLAFITGGREHQSTAQRLAGFTDTLSKHAITLPSQWLIEGQYSFESGVEGAKQLLAETRKPTAIVACNDEIAAGALFAARLMNFDIPSQLSIVGFENSPFSRQTWPKLTTAGQPNQEIAYQAALSLLNRLRHISNKQAHLYFAPELIVRDSTAALQK